jgi:hypothetical protein
LSITRIDWAVKWHPKQCSIVNERCWHTCEIVQ